MEKVNIANKILDIFDRVVIKKADKDLEDSKTEIKDDGKPIEQDDEQTINEIKDTLEHMLVDLDKRVDYFLDEYYKFVCNKMGNYVAACERVSMNAFIGRIVAWYETTYPDDALFYEFPSKYVNVRNLTNSLPASDKDYLHKHRYKDEFKNDGYIYLNNDSIDYLMHADLYVSVNGIITDAGGVYRFSGKRVNESEIIGLKLDEAVEVFKKAGVYIENTKLMKIVNDHNKRLELREEMLDAIMYRLIEHGAGDNKGCMRAYIFAKDFGRDSRIPVIYSHIEGSKAYREFINTYVHDNGSLDIEHYNNYFLDKYSSIIPDDEKFLKSPLRTDMAKTNNMDYNTDEETGLYQRFANKLVTGLVTSEAIDEMRTEAIKEMRLERKIAKSKRR